MIFRVTKFPFVLAALVLLVAVVVFVAFAVAVVGGFMLHKYLRY